MEEMTKAALSTKRWDEMADYYEAFLEPASSALVDGTFALVGGISHLDDVLDMGAGTGYLAMEAAERGARVLAIDASPAMVAHISSRLEKGGYKDATARVMDGQALELPDASFNKAFSMFGLVVFPDWRRGMAELARVVRPGGSGCVAVFPNAEGGPAFRLLYEAYSLMDPDSVPLPVSPTFAALADRSTLQREMEQAGFHAVTLHEVERMYQPESADWQLDHADHLFRPLPFYSRLDASGIQTLREAMRSVFSRYETGGGYSVPNSALVAVGRR